MQQIATIIIIIFSCSLFGRSIWSLLISLWDRLTLMLVFGLLLSLCVYFISMSLKAIIAIVATLSALYFIFNFQVEEFLHCILFGSLGFYSAVLAQKNKANMRYLLLGFCMAAIDELLQLALPDRVGDIRDVVLNLVSFITVYTVYYNQALTVRPPRS